MASLNGKTIRSLAACVLLLGTAVTGNSATFQTFVNDQAGFLAAIGSGTIVTTENFASAVDQGQVAAPGAQGDSWNGIFINRFGNNISFGGSKYCQDLGAPNCIYWNGAVPRVPGLYGDMGLNSGISIKPKTSSIAGISFDFADWNDGSIKSNLLILASDGTSTVVNGPVNAPPSKFAVTLSSADIAAGRYVTEVRWLGLNGASEIVGFSNIQTFSNPVITSNPKPVPSTNYITLILLTMLIALAMKTVSSRHLD